jgi:predicted phosphoribosyltransferase
MVIKIFKNRADAGQFLAEKLTAYANRSDVIVLGLPRGGVPVAYEVARSLRAPLDVFMVRKLGVPGHEELAFGAIASGGVLVLNEEVIAAVNLTRTVIDWVIEDEQRELDRREQEFRGELPPVDVSSKTVIVVDDGMATGSSMHAAVRALRPRRPAQIVVAVPVGARATCESFQNEADLIAVCAITPEQFTAVGQCYADFAQITDDEVRRLLARSREARKAA